MDSMLPETSLFIMPGTHIPSVENEFDEMARLRIKRNFLYM